MTTRRSRAHHLRGLGRLAAEATLGLSELVEAVHGAVEEAPPPLGPPAARRTSGIAGLVYGGVRGVTRLVGTGIDAALERLAPVLGDLPPSPRREALVAALNGVLGDHLEETGNPLAIRMTLRRHGRDLAPDAASLAAAFPAPPACIVLMVHGLCMNDAGWRRGGHDHGAALERDGGFAVLHVVYNSGRRVAGNGADLAALLEALVGAWPGRPCGISILAHSMGGLVARSALHAGLRSGRSWPALVRTAVFLGTPHHGAPLERLGNLFQSALGASPYSLPFARLGRIRSAGITDLRHGTVLDDDDGGDRFSRQSDTRPPLPLPAGVAGCAVAGTRARAVGESASRLPGDGLVPVASALGRHRDPERTLLFPAGRSLVVPATDHFGLLSSAEVYARVRDWLDDAADPRT